MSMTDPIADMLTRIRNANANGADTVSMPSSQLKVGLAKALEREGFINSFTEEQEDPNHPRKTLKIRLRYGPNGERVIQFIDRISTPGRRIYAPVKGLPRVLSGMGCTILSTSKGVLSDRECRQQKVGGELLCKVG